MYYYQPQNNPYGQMQQSAPQGLKGRPVSSLEEVRAAQIDFDGSLFVFPDIANKRIYTKQINLDGTAALNVYELTTLPTVTGTADYVTRSEFQNALDQIKAALTNKPDGSQPTENKTETPQFNF